jgi:hypothetical protein
VRAKFSARVQTGPGAHPGTYAMGNGSVSSGAKRPGRGVDHPHASSAEVKERVELFLYSTSGPSWPVIGRTVPLPLRSYAVKMRCTGFQNCAKQMTYEARPFSP